MWQTFAGMVILLVEAIVAILVLATWGLIRAMTRPRRLTTGAALGRGLPTDPADLQLDGEEVRLPLPDGHTAPGWRIVGRDPDGPRVILCHGWSGSRFGSLAKTPLFVPAASEVLAYDMRGHGDHTAPITTLGHREVDDLVAIVNGMPDDGRPVVLFGSSFGAGVALEATLRLQDTGSPVAGAILDGPYRRAMEPVASRLRGNGYPAQPLCFLAGLFLSLRWRRFGRYDRAEQAGRLQCPLLVLHGSEDAICPLASARTIAEAAPQGRLVVIAGGGHGGLALADPQQYRDAVASFITSLRRSQVKPQ